MARTLHDRVLQALTDRSVWEDKQRLWYTMRHEGLPRRNKPFVGAADLHLPLGDNAVEKQKPFFVNSAFSRDRLAAFTPLNSDQLEASASAAECLDWKIRKESNYRREYDYLLDSMLVGGRAVLKVLWRAEEDAEPIGGEVDANDDASPRSQAMSAVSDEGEEMTERRPSGRLLYESIDPLFFIVPRRTDDLQEADWVCHVKQMSVAAYERDGRYDQDPELIKRITGGAEQADKHGKEQEKARREGITYSSDEDTIVLWETWERVKSGWRVSTYSPCAEERPVRADFLCPYRRQGKPFLPFVAWQWEVTEKGWYAPRGVIEKIGPHETYGTKLWNGKADFLEYSMRPLFSSQPGYEIKNSSNIRLRPGEVLPPGVAPASMPAPPMQLDEEINSVRVLAEESVQSPDFGAHREGDSKETRTATEISYVQSFASQGIQYRAQVTGQSEGEVYSMSWALLVQFGGDDLVYFSSNDRQVLPPQARHDNYLIEPDAQPDTWNKTLRAQRAVGRFGMFKGDPDIDQIELKRSVLQADDPRLVKRLLIGKGTAEAEEREDEAKDVLLLEALWPAQTISVKPSENHALRLTVLFGRMDMLNKLGIPPNPLVRQNLQAHALMHLQMLKEQNPKLARQFEQAAAVVSGAGGPGAQGTEGGQVAGVESGMGAGAPAGEMPELEAQPEGMAV